LGKEQEVRVIAEIAGGGLPSFFLLPVFTTRMESHKEQASRYLSLP
jgi:hypothetical protein